MSEKRPFDIKEVKEGLNRLVAFGLLNYDSKQDTYIDSNFSKELTEVKHRTAITRLINRVEKYVRNQTIEENDKIWFERLKEHEVKWKDKIIEEVLKIVDEVNIKEWYFEWRSNLSKLSFYETIRINLKEKIKKINSQEIPGLAGADTSMNRLNSPIRQTSEASEDCKPDTNTQNIHTGGAQSTGGLTGGEVKSEETYNGVNSQKPVICKPEPLCPPANNQNLKGCGKYIEDMDGVCGIDGLCEKCQGKVR